MQLRGFARVFAPGEDVVCGRCNSPDHLKLSRDGVTLVCDHTIGKGKDRKRCRQRHYVLTAHDHRAVVAIPRDTYAAMVTDGVTTDRLWVAGVIQAAFAVLSEVDHDRSDRARAA